MPTIFSSFDEIWHSDNFGTFTKSARVKDHRGVDLISDVLPFGRLWY
jgi:hypothetical protein